MHASSPPHIVGASHLLAGIALFPRDAAAAELRQLGINDCAPLRDASGGTERRSRERPSARSE